MKNTEVIPTNGQDVRANYRTPEYRVRVDGDDYVAEIAIPGVPKEGVEIGVESDK